MNVRGLNNDEICQCIRDVMLEYGFLLLNNNMMCPYITFHSQAGTGTEARVHIGLVGEVTVEIVFRIHIGITLVTDEFSLDDKQTWNKMNANMFDVIYAISRSEDEED